LEIEESVTNLQNAFSIITDLWNHFEKEKNKLIDETQKIQQAFNLMRQQLEEKNKQCQQFEEERRNLLKQLEEKNKQCQQFEEERRNLLKQVEEKAEQLEKEKKRLYEV
jgi:uncharacterized coiled-coil DUF342 family protein